MAVEIVFAEDRHADDAWCLLQEYFDSVGVVVRDSRDYARRAMIWLAYSEGSAVGCILLRVLDERRGEVKRLYVRSAFRGYGVAGLLLAALEKHAIALGMTDLYLDSKDDLAAAVRFYQRSGYTSCERYNDNPQATIFMRKSLPVQLTMREFQAGDEEAFWALNVAWISKLFALEDKDIQTLRNPQKCVIEPGGRIYFACRGDETIGCCALLPMPNGNYELAKMGVAESERGKGIGRALLEYVVAEARKLGIAKLYIESNTKLKNAIHLYEAIGFVHIQPDRPSPYQRSDVFMELKLA